MSIESISANTVVLVAFYNKKALGVRYLETALKGGGYEVKTVFYKDFNSISPSKTTKKELSLLCDVVNSAKPVFVGLSVMSSMYLDTVHDVITALRERCNVKIVCGGAYASMFPKHFLNLGVEYIIRSDGEIPMRKLADALANKTAYEHIPSLCYKRGAECIINEIGDIKKDVDDYGIPTINSKSACFIENDTIAYGDPQLSMLSYEVIASRGCPFTCSYCCCINLRRLMPKEVKAVRTRSVKSVINELIEAKKECRRIAFVHFYDEIFPNLPGWVDEFIIEYKKYINLPFTIWSHPKMVDGETLKKLVKAGLVEVIMGIQSGSEHIRRDVFHRYETNKDIKCAAEAITDAGVFWASYDFMLQHPFENIDDLKETYYLVKELSGRYELQLHGLNFLPGTDIVDMAVSQGFYTKEEMNAVMYAPMEEQFGAYWRQENSQQSRLWYKLIYLWQFRAMRKKCMRYEKEPLKFKRDIERDYSFSRRLAKLRYLYKKAFIVAKRYSMN